MLAKIVLPVDELVIGCSLESLIYCFFTGKPFLYSRKEIPHDYDYLDSVDQLKHFCYNFQPKQLISPNSSKLSLPQKKIIWDRIFFILSLQGYSLMPNECASIKIEKDIVKAFTPNARMGVFKCDKITIFDDHAISGLHRPRKNDKVIYKVYDWYRTTSCSSHTIDYIETEDNFIKEIIFFPKKSGFVYLNNRRDALSVSFIKKRKIDLYEWSDIAARFKTIHVMKENGIRGTRNGRDVLDKTKTKYYSLKLKNIKRDVVAINRENIYLNKNNINFVYKTYSELLEEYKFTDSPFNKTIERFGKANESLSCSGNNTREQSANGFSISLA